MCTSQVETMMKKGGELRIYISFSFDYDSWRDANPSNGTALHQATYILDAANNHLPGYAG